MGENEPRSQALKEPHAVGPMLHRGCNGIFHRFLGSQQLTCVSTAGSSGIVLALTLHSLPYLLKINPRQGLWPGESRKAGRAGIATCSTCDGKGKGTEEEHAESAPSKQAGAESPDHHLGLSRLITDNRGHQ